MLIVNNLSKQAAKAGTLNFSPALNFFCLEITLSPKKGQNQAVVSTKKIHTTVAIYNTSFDILKSRKILRTVAFFVLNLPKVRKTSILKDIFLSKLARKPRAFKLGDIVESSGFFNGIIQEAKVKQ